MYTFTFLYLFFYLSSSHLTLRKGCPCHEICTSPCENAAPGTKSALHLAKMLPLPRNMHFALRLPRNLHFTLRKCCPCHEICASPCEHAAPATKSVLDLAKLLPLPRNLYFCENAAPATKYAPDLAKMLRLPRNSILAKPLCCRANGPGVRTRPHPSEAVPSMLRPDAANKLDFGSPATRNHVEGHTFSRFLFPRHTRARIFSCVLILFSWLLSDPSELAFI